MEMAPMTSTVMRATVMRCFSLRFLLKVRTRMSFSTVEAHISSRPSMVDIMAAASAANTRPPSTGGSRLSIIMNTVLSGEDRSGNRTLPHRPMTMMQTSITQTMLMIMVKPRFCSFGPFRE